MWTTAWLSVALAGSSVLVEPGTLELTHSPPPVVDLDPLEPAGRCLVRTRLDPRGVPVEVEARGCVGDYQQAAEQAVKTFRWKPPGEVAETLVPLRFTPKSRVDIEEEPRCVYTVQIARDGSVSASRPLPQSQCQVWPAERVTGDIPSAGTCEVAVRRTIRRDQDQWLDLSGCPAEAHAAVTDALRGTLFSFGAEATRFRVELPSTAGAPPASSVTLDIPEGPEQALEATRIETGEAEQGEATGLQDVPDHEVPTATLPSLSDLMKKKEEEAEEEEE